MGVNYPATGGGQIVADHIPMILHPQLSVNGTLRGHIARNNPLVTNIDEAFGALIMFQGPHHYISPSWYPSKEEYEKVVPTWNYIMVHARGHIKFHKDPKWLLEHLTHLTQSNESQRSNPWQVSDAPDDFVARQLKGIIGLEIEIESLQGTWKTSQNKTTKDNQGVSLGLENEPSDMAKKMAKTVAQRRVIK